MRGEGERSEMVGVAVAENGLAGCESTGREAVKPTIIYCSQTGFTKRYAEWLAEEYGCEAIPYGQRASAPLSRVVVFCSWFHAGGLKGAKWLHGVAASHPGTAFVVVGCGAYPMPCERWPQSDIDEAFENSLGCSSLSNLTCFYCQGGFNFEGLGAMDKVAMRMFFKMLEKKEEEDPRNAEVLDTMRGGFDGTNREYLRPAIEKIDEELRVHEGL